MELISIIVPVYNVEKYVTKCIDSILAQTYKNIEVILVDDGSTDKSGSICDEYANKDKRVKVIHKKNGGLSSARNAGIKKATGNYLIFVDGDDYINPIMTATLFEDLTEHKADISICNRYYINEDGTNKRIRFKNKKNLVMDKEEALTRLICMTDFDMSAWCKIYKKVLFTEILFPEGKYSEDYYIMSRLFELCNKITYNFKPLLYYVQRNGSITKKKDIIMDYIIAAKEQMTFIKKNYPSLSLYAESAYALSYLTIYNKQVKNNNNALKTMQKRFKDKTNGYRKSVYRNENISVAKKLGMFLFSHFPAVYNIIVKRYSGF